MTNSIEQTLNELIASLNPEQIKKVLTQVKTSGPIKVDSNRCSKDAWEAVLD